MEPNYPHQKILTQIMKTEGRWRKATKWKA